MGPIDAMVAAGLLPFSSLKSFIEIGPYRTEVGMERTDLGDFAAVAAAAASAAALTAEGNFVTLAAAVDIFDHWGVRKVFIE